MITYSYFNTGSDGSKNIVNNQAFSGSQYIEIYSVGTDQSVKFKAFVDSFADNYTSEWNNESVLGRMDGIATFKSTKRDISLDFSAPASSEEEASAILAKISYLISFLYPNYDTRGSDNTKTLTDGATLKLATSRAATMVSAPLVKIRFGNLIRNSFSHENDLDVVATGLLGYLSGFNYSPNFELGTFINDNGEMLPKSVKIILKFTVIHTHPLGFDERGIERSGFSKHPYNKYDKVFSVRERMASRPEPVIRASDTVKTELL